MRQHVLIFLLLPFISFAQNRITDSLEKAASIENDLEKRIEIKAKLLLKYYTKGQAEKAFSTYNSSLKEAQALPTQKSLALLIHTRGTLFYYESNFDSALACFKKALEIRNRISDKEGILKSTVNIGSIYFMLGNHKEALVYYETGQRKERELNYDEGEFISLNNLGTIYNSLRIQKEALRYFKRAESIYISKDKKGELIYTYDGLANVYKDLGKPDTALFYAYKCRALSKLLEDNRSLGYCLLNIALFNNDLKNYSLSKKYLDSSIAIATASKDKKLELTAYANLAAIDLTLKQPDSAYKYIDKIMALQDLPEFTNHRFELAEVIAKYYYEKKDFEKAFMYLDLQQKYKDSIYNKEVTAQISEMRAKYDLDIKEQENRILTTEKEAYQTSFTLLVIILLLGLAAAIGGVIAYNKIKKSNALLGEQKEEISRQKEIVDEKQKEILDSITYARRIQFALLAGETLLKEHLPQHFVLFKPKDVVSGDFYWATSSQQGDVQEKHFYLAVCDSTGHGVPGAFMSLLNISFLNEAVNEKHIYEPHQILNHVRRRLIENMGEGRDGMDAVLIKIPAQPKTKTTIEYAAANNVPVLIKNGALVNLQKDKMPVGRGENLNSFATHTIEVENGDSLYLYTDGFADQFGGPKGKKFMYKQLDNVLLSNCQKNHEEQAQILSKHFESWRGSHEQVDDVCIIGMRF